jgi:uncharacterized protein (DUF58 family)
VHWRSTARTGRLLVKEFETGAYGRVAFMLQRTLGSDIGQPGESSLDRACGHVAYIAQQMLKQGTDVSLPGLLPPGPSGVGRHEYEEIAGALAGVAATNTSTVGEDLLAHRADLPQGATVYVLLSVADETLPIAAASLKGLGILVVVLAYDPLDFQPGLRLRSLQSPIESDYLARLRAAGVKVMIMPRKEAA